MATGTPGSDRVFTPRFTVALLVVTGAALALRYYKLGAWSYWSDEAFTISDAHSWFRGAGGRLPEHGLSFWLYGLWFEVARYFALPFDEIVARCVPAFFGGAAVFFTGALGRRVAGGTGALAAAALLAVSPFHLYWSQNARSYALEVCLAIPAALVLGSAFLSGRVASFVLGSLLFILAAFAHPTALALAPGLLLFAAVGRRFGESASQRMPWLWIAGGTAAAALVVALSPLGRAIWVHFQVKSGASPKLYLSTVAYYFRPTLLAAAGALAVAGWLRRDRKSLFLSLLGFGTLATGFAASCVVRVNSQYVITALPFLALLAGREVSAFAASGALRARPVATALCLALFADFSGGAFLYYTSDRGYRAQWREACEFVYQRRRADDVLATTQSAIVEVYLNPSNPLPRHATASLYLGPYEPLKFEVVPRLARRAWFMILDVDLDEWKRADRDRFEGFLRERCRAVAEWPLQFAGKDQTLRIWRYDP
jgi:hypothetical protein